MHQLRQVEIKQVEPSANLAEVPASSVCLLALVFQNADIAIT